MPHTFWQRHRAMSVTLESYPIRSAARPGHRVMVPLLLILIDWRHKIQTQALPYWFAIVVAGNWLCIRYMSHYLERQLIDFCMPLVVLVLLSKLWVYLLFEWSNKLIRAPVNECEACSICFYESDIQQITVYPSYTLLTLFTWFALLYCALKNIL